MGKRTIKQNRKEDTQGGGRRPAVAAVVVTVAVVVLGIVVAAVALSRGKRVPGTNAPGNVYGDGTGNAPGSAYGDGTGNGAGTAPGEGAGGPAGNAPGILTAAVYDEELPGSRVEQLLENAGGMAVHLKTASSFGSGVIFTATEDSLYVVTAAHVLPEKNVTQALPEDIALEKGEVLVTFCDGAAVPCREIKRAEDADIAFLRIPLTELPEGRTEQYRCAAVNKETYDVLTGWDTVLCMGVREDAGAAAYEGYLVDNWIYVEDFAQYMILAKCQIYPGMSGGGLYDERGYLIGVACGGNEQGELAAVPLHIVQAKYTELEQVKYTEQY